MTLAATPIRRRFQRGSVVRGAIVATALVGALGLQLAGPRLQCRLAALVGIEWVPPGAMPMAAPMPSPSSSSCGSASGAYPAHPCKVAVAAFDGTAPTL